MTAYAVEQGVCHGRDFTGTGLLNKLDAFMTRAPAISGGGAGWIKYDDQSGLSTDPYIVYCNVASPVVNTPGLKFIQFKLTTLTGLRIEIRPYLWWNLTTHTGFGGFAAHNVTTADSADFTGDYRGGPEFLSVMSFVSAWSIWAWDEMDLDANLDVNSFVGSVNSTNISGDPTFQIDGMDITAGLVNAIDANGWSYIRVVNTSGSNYQINFYNNSSYTTLVAQTAIFANPAGKSLIAFSQVSASTVAGNIRVTGPLVAAASIAYRVNRIDIPSGQISNYQVGDFLFIYDFSENRNAVNYFQVLAINGNILTTTNLYRPFSALARLGTYPHPYIVFGTGNSLMEGRSNIPYHSVIGSIANYHNGNSPNDITPEFNSAGAPNWLVAGNRCSPSIGFSTDDRYITRMSPNDKNVYALQKPGVYEYRTYGRTATQPANGNRGYGQPRSFVLGDSTGLTVNVHQRRVNGIDYTFFNTADQLVADATAWGYFVRETQSAT